MPPTSPAGPIDFPRWGDIYWATGFETGGQDKRYVVVSHDHHNKATRRPFLVRTTTAPKRNVQDFPVVQDGAAHSCPGELRTAGEESVSLARRPTPDHLVLADMVATAYGIASTLQLEAAVIRNGGAFPDS